MFHKTSLFLSDLQSNILAVCEVSVCMHALDKVFKEAGGACHTPTVGHAGTSLATVWHASHQQWGTPHTNSGARLTPTVGHATHQKWGTPHTKSGARHTPTVGCAGPSLATVGHATHQQWGMLVHPWQQWACHTPSQTGFSTAQEFTLSPNKSLVS